MDYRVCLHCGVRLVDRYKIRFCSNKCQADFLYTEYIKSWRAGVRNGNRGIATRNLSAHIKRYLLAKYKNKCSSCGWDKVNLITQKVPLEIDHIDGDAENNSESNLRLICPNCHALTVNFKNLNKGKGRRWRMDKYLRNKA